MGCYTLVIIKIRFENHAVIFHFPHKKLNFSFKISLCQKSVLVYVQFEKMVQVLVQKVYI
jgi:hypothetical protein